MPGEGGPHIRPQVGIDRLLRVHDIQDLKARHVKRITELLFQARQRVADRLVVFHAFVAIRTSFGTDLREDRAEGEEVERVAGLRLHAELSPVRPTYSISPLGVLTRQTYSQKPR